MNVVINTFIPIDFSVYYFEAFNPVLSGRQFLLFISTKCAYYLNTYIYLLHVLVFVKPSAGSPLLYWLKNYLLFAMSLHRLCCKM